MEEWLTPDIAVLLMLIGVVPSFLNVYLLYDERRKPGVIWFLVSMVAGGVWAFLFAAFTFISSPTVTLVLANFFWAVVPVAAISMFLLAYEYVFKTTIRREISVALFTPVLLLFFLSWFNPANIVFTAEYYVDSDGFLHFSVPGGVFKFLVVQVYGYSLTFLAAGMFVGDAIRSSGIQRRHTLYLLITFTVLVGSTIVKVAGLVPIYYDPTSTVYALSGLFFSYSISRHGLLKSISVTRDQTFEESNNAIFIIDSQGMIVDTNNFGRKLFGTDIVGERAEEVFPDNLASRETGITRPIRLYSGGIISYFSVHTSPVQYGRGLEGTILTLTDVSVLKERENELNLLKEIFSRLFRHNIRNDFTVINGYAGIIAENGDDRTVELANSIREKSGQLLAQTEKARKIEQIIERDSITTGSLRDAVEAATSPSLYDGEVVIRSDVEDVIVEFHPHFHLAIKELIENAIAHIDTGEVPELDIFTEREDDFVVLVIEDNGSGIPDDEIEALQAEAETSLLHGSGIGLWLVKWIVNHSNATMVATSDHDGTRIEIRLPGIES